MYDKIDNRYRVVKTLGSGLSGEVLAVEDKDGEKALKFLKRVQFNVSREEALASFKNEFSILSELNHPGIARILDFGFDTHLEKYFFTTELVKGQDFFLATEGKPIEVIEELAVQVLRALNYLHSRGVYHLDIKPQNVLVQEKGGKLQTKLIDFGLSGFSNPRKKVGTPAYMAPEVILGSLLDGRTDLYSFGVLLYKALTRENPFASKNVRETLERHRTMVPKPVSEMNAMVPQSWDRIVGRLLEKVPSDRYPQGSAVIRDINFLNNKNYEIETMESRLSYLPEKGSLVGRNKQTDIFQTLFDMIFIQDEPNASRLLIVEGKTGTGKTRLLNEFKYYSQLKNIPVYSWEQFKLEKLESPFCLQIDSPKACGPDEINLILQKYGHEKILILWATTKAPSGWSRCEVVTLDNFSEDEFTNYLIMVTGLTNPPRNLIKDIYHRTDGNPLFVTELLKTMLANNVLLDSSGRWAHSTFEDIEINFENIQIPNTLVDLLKKNYNSLNISEQNILEWLSVFNREVPLEILRLLTHIDQPQSFILTLTKEDLIERTTREHHYFFKNVLLRGVIYESLEANKKQHMHDEIAHFLEGDINAQEEYFYHIGHGSHPQRAIDALIVLSDKYSDKNEFAMATSIMEEAWNRASTMELLTQIEVETKLAESYIMARNYKKAIQYYEHLNNLVTSNPKITSTTLKQIEVNERLGDLYTKLDQFDKALDIFNEALKQRVNDPSDRVSIMVIENHIANVYMKSGKIDKAEEIYLNNCEKWEKELSLEEKKKVTNNYLAQLFILKKEYDLALAQVEKDIDFYEKNQTQYLVCKAYYVKGELFYWKMLNDTGLNRNDKKRKAVDAYQHCNDIAKKMQAYDQMLRSYNGIANLYYEEKDYSKSSDYYSRALALARKQEDYQSAAVIALNLGNIYKIEKKYSDAYSHLVYSLNTLENIEPKNYYNWLYLFNAHVELAETYRETGDYIQASSTLSKAEKIIENQPTLKSYNFWIFLEKAKIEFKLNNDQACLSLLKKAEDLAIEGHEIEGLNKFKEEIKATEINKPQRVYSSLRHEESSAKEASMKVTDKYESILQINKFINSEHDPEHLLKMVLNYALELSGAETGLVLMINNEGVFEIQASVNTLVNSNLTDFSTSIARRVLETGKEVVLADALQDDRFHSSESIVLNEMKSILCLPIRSKNKVIGVFYLDNRFRIDAFKDVDGELMHAFCDQVGIALENAQLFSKYQEAQGKLENQLKEASDELHEVKEKLNEETSLYLSKYSYDNIISRSKPMREIFKLLDKITETNLSLYILGASGTGKELIARALHYNNSPRANKRFVAIDCGAIPPTLIESELFGYKKGAFTGANTDKKGLFEEANGGTIFLDEIAELGLDLQVKLLRVLQEGEVRKIGDTQSTKVDVRVVCASHRDINQMVKKGDFREDLFYRLCQITLKLPQLKDRKEDIPLLVDHFIAKYRKENKIEEQIKPAKDFLRVLLQYEWPGNIRELENLISVACALREENSLTLSSLPPTHDLRQSLGDQGRGLSVVGSNHMGNREPIKNVPLDEKNIYDPSKTWEQYEAAILAKCYKANEYKKVTTAEMLDISHSTFYKKIKDFDLDNKDNPLYSDSFTYEMGLALKDYIPIIFRASLAYSDSHPYAAIKRLGVSQGFFYKIIKTFKVWVA